MWYFVEILIIGWFLMSKVLYIKEENLDFKILCLCSFVFG